MRKNGGIRTPEEVYRGRAPPPKPIAYRAVDKVRIDVEMKRRHFRRDFHSPMAFADGVVDGASARYNNLVQLR